MKKIVKVLMLVIAVAVLAPSSVLAGSYELSGYKERTYFEERINLENINRRGGNIRVRLDSRDSYFEDVTLNIDNGRYTIKNKEGTAFDFYVDDKTKNITLSGYAILYKGDKNLRVDITELNPNNGEIVKNIRKYDNEYIKRYNPIKIFGERGERITLEVSDGYSFVNSYDDIIGGLNRRTGTKEISFNIADSPVLFAPIISGNSNNRLEIKCTRQNGEVEYITLDAKDSNSFRPSNRNQNSGSQGQNDTRAKMPQSKDQISIDTVAVDISKDSYGLKLNRVDISEKIAGQLRVGGVYAVSLPKTSTMTFKDTGRLTAKNASLKNVKISEDKKSILFEISKITDGKQASIYVDDLSIETNTEMPSGAYTLHFSRLVDPLVQEPLSEFDLLESREIVINGREYVLKAIDKTNFVEVNNNFKEVGDIVFQIGKKKYLLNGEEGALDVAPFIRNNYTMMPLRAVGEVIGLSVDWVDNTKTVTLTDESGNLLLVRPGESFYRKNGKKVKMPTKAIVKDSRIFLPISVIAEAFDLKRDKDFFWDQENMQVRFVIQVEK